MNKEEAFGLGMSLVIIGAIIVVAIRVIYTFIPIWEIQYGYVVGTFIMLIGMIFVCIGFEVFKKPCDDR